MKKSVLIIILVLIFAAMIPANVFAAMTDTRSSIETRYGEAWYVFLRNGDRLTMTEWLALPEQSKRHAVTFVYKAKLRDIGAQIVVKYDEYSFQPSDVVRGERIVFDCPIKIKELKQYLPEEWAVLNSDKATAFVETAKYFKGQFEEVSSPLSYGVVIEDFIAPERKFYTIYGFSVVNEGVWVNNPTDITPDTYIKEIIIMQVDKSVVKAFMTEANKKWLAADNFFVQKKAVAAK